MAFGFEKPCIHDTHAITAEVGTDPGWSFAFLKLTFKDAEGNETELEVYLPKRRAVFARRIADAINAVSDVTAESEAA